MTKWITTFIMMIIFALIMTNKKMEMKVIFKDYQNARGSWAKEVHINRGREIMRPKLLPYILEIYGSGQAVEFPAAMVAHCSGDEGTAHLWKLVDDPETAPFIRTICMAHLLDRDQLSIWSEITDEDIDLIAASAPAHVVHWKTLLLKCTGKPYTVFKGDSIPGRHKFKALFRDCIEIYKLDDEERMEQKKRRSTRQASNGQPARNPASTGYQRSYA